MLCFVRTVMVSTRAHLVQLNIVMLVAFAAGFERLALSFPGSGDWTAKSVIDDWTRVFELTPDLDQEPLQFSKRRAFDRLFDGRPLWWWSRRARGFTINVARNLCTFGQSWLLSINHTSSQIYHSQSMSLQSQPCRCRWPVSLPCE